MGERKIELSVIVPLYNEEESVELLYRSILRAIEPLSLTYEVIFVDDGSRDRTFEISKELARGDERLKIIKFRKNYGQTPAMVAGIEHARGEILITMDGDLQNDPADIPKFLDKMKEGYDIVCGWRHKRQDKLFSRKIPSIIANKIIGFITGVFIRDNGCSLKSYRAKLIKKIPLYSDMHRFIPAMASIAGTKVAEIMVSHHPRRFGVSKYGITRIYKVIVDLIVIKTLISFATKPLRLFTYAALASLAMGVISLTVSLGGLVWGNLDIDFMMASGGLLFFILSFFLIFIGLLCELAIETGDYRGETLIIRKVE